MSGDDIDSESVAEAGTAFANRMLFGVTGFYDSLVDGNPVATADESGDNAVSVCIVPAAQ